jgi:hypothetical protein
MMITGQKGIDYLKKLLSYGGKESKQVEGSHLKKRAGFSQTRQLVIAPAATNF